jgi:hypothetical protein
MMPLITIIIILTTILIYFVNSYFALSSDLKKLKPLSVMVTPETKANDMSLIYDSIDKALLKSLYYYVCKDIEFDPKSSVKKYFSGHYRDLIAYLVNPDIFITDIIDDEEVRRPFSSVFIQRVYYLYIAETPECIKSLLFKYYSGYTVEDYFKKKRGRPSVAAFISEYVTYYLMSRYEENKIAEAKLLNNLNKSKTTSAKTYQAMVEAYDKQCILKLTSGIYSIYGTGVSDSIAENNYTETQNKPTNKTSREVNNEFAVDFHEPSK